MTRTEHLQWCKERALKLVEQQDLQGAFTSMMSDLNKHDGTRGHMAIEMGIMLQMSGHLNTKEKMHDFIDGFN